MCISDSVLYSYFDTLSSPVNLCYNKLNMKTKFLATTLLFVLTFTTIQAQEKIKGSRNVTVEQTEIEPFTAMGNR